MLKLYFQTHQQWSMKKRNSASSAVTLLTIVCLLESWHHLVRRCHWIGKIPGKQISLIKRYGRAAANDFLCFKSKSVEVEHIQACFLVRKSKTVIFSLDWYQHSLVDLCAPAIHLTSVGSARLQLGVDQLVCEWPAAGEQQMCWHRVSQAVWACSACAESCQRPLQCSRAVSASGAHWSGQMQHSLELPWVHTPQCDFASSWKTLCKWCLVWLMLSKIWSV